MIQDWGMRFCLRSVENRACHIWGLWVCSHSLSLKSPVSACQTGWERQWQLEERNTEETRRAQGRLKIPRERLVRACCPLLD